MAWPIYEVIDECKLPAIFPLITPERWLKDFEEAGFKEEVKPLILKANAVRLLNLGASRPV